MKKYYVIILIVLTTLSTTSLMITATSTSNLSMIFNNNQKAIIEAGEQFQYSGVSIRWYLSEAVKLNSSELIVYIDPIEIHVHEEPADFIIITHNHAPHYSPNDIEKLTDPHTIIISSPQTPGDYIVRPGDVLSFDGIDFEFVPAYNIHRFRPNGEPYHRPEDDGLGVIIDFGMVRIYVAGDTGPIPEMATIETDIALLPVGGLSIMNATDAAVAVELIKNSSDLMYVIPFHYGYNGITDDAGSISDAFMFRDLVNCSVVMLDSLEIWYPHELSSLEILNPNHGDQLFSNVTLYWKASDTWKHDLLYHLDYSNDSGITWYRFAAYEISTTYTWDTSSYQDGTYKIRVTAICLEETDTFLSMEAISDEFSINNTVPFLTETHSLTSSPLSNYETKSRSTAGMSLLSYLLSLLLLLSIQRKKKK
ncbi:MAG: MBL fold metallo-hydrolase [Candidatus Hermodarchaeota archaeon]